MPREQKVEIVDKLVAVFSTSSMVIATDYRGLSVSEMSELRHRLRQIGVEYRVVKNTLAEFAAQRSGKPELVHLLKGPTALVLGYGDIIQAAKVIADYQQAWKTTLTIRGGLLERRALSAEEIVSLATVPPAPVLLARLLGVMEGPIRALENVLNANLRTILALLQARIQQLEVPDGH